MRVVRGWPTGQGWAVVGGLLLAMALTAWGWVQVATDSSLWTWKAKANRR
jgi:hypothetical protein